MRACRGLLLLCCTLAVATPPGGSALAQEDGQYRSRIRLDPDTLGEGYEMSLEELERQIDGIADPYARSSAGRHLARHYVEQKDYPKAIEYYRTALSAQGLSDIANREMLRELAQVYLLSKDYAQAATTLQRALRIDLVPEATDYLLLAQAWYRQQQYVQVVAALDEIAARGLALTLPQQRQALALYYRAGAYAQCERLLRGLLQAEPDDPETWHQLAAVYLQQGKRKQALDQLVLARDKGVPFREQDTLLLADLQAVNGNPYGAAETLSAALAAGSVKGDAARYRKLFEFWLAAREPERAGTALERAARLSGDTELYLYLAQLQMEREAWQDMHRTIVAACAKQLEDRFVGRANLLLGVSQLKLGDAAGARRSFINATLVGGANQQAGRWLDFMQAEPPTKRELLRVEGICVGAQGSREAIAELEDVAAMPQAAGGEEVNRDGGLQTRTVPAQRLYYQKLDMPLEEIGARVQSLATAMGVALVKAGGAVDGPLQIILQGEPGAAAGMELAFPVKGAPQGRGKYRLRRSEAFECAYAVHRGPPAELGAAIAQLVAAVQASGHGLAGEVRLLFAAPTGGDDPEIEILVGIR